MTRENKLLQLSEEWEHAIIMNAVRGQAVIYNGWEERTSYYNVWWERTCYIIMDKERRQAIF